MKRDVELTEYVCDGCGRGRLTSAIDGPALGYHGNVMWVHGAGGDGGQWFACTSKCIRKAVLRSLELSSMNPDEYAEAVGS